MGAVDPIEEGEERGTELMGYPVGSMPTHSRLATYPRDCGDLKLGLMHKRKRSSVIRSQSAQGVD
nr:hypothetical protein Iba_chr11aCG2390 [Ipomoea batatas]GMD56288.1 hypothetical protein Iba_chr11eCG1740 [Ipomoea batatas]